MLSIIATFQHVSARGEVLLALGTVQRLFSWSHLTDPHHARLFGRERSDRMSVLIVAITGDVCDACNPATGST